MLDNAAPVLLSRANAVTTLTLNRPAKLNAINDQLTMHLEHALRQADEDESVRVVVLRGAGRGFMAGADLEEFAAHPEQAPAMAAHFQQAIRFLVSMRKPVIASLHGAVAGGGLALALACDLAIAADDLRMVFAYTKLGVTCDGGLSYWLPRLVGTRKALEIALIGGPIDAAEALRLGLVNRVVPADQIGVETDRMAERLAQLDPLAAAQTKALFAESWHRVFHDQLNAELEAFAVCADRPEFRQRVSAIIAKQ